MAESVGRWRSKRQRSEGTESKSNESSGSSTDLPTADHSYLVALQREKLGIEAMLAGDEFNPTFIHLHRLIDLEIDRVSLLTNVNRPVQMVLPKPTGQIVKVTRTIRAPTELYPDYNFVGRILGPRGMTVKQLEYQFGCKIHVSGKGTKNDGEDDADLFVSVSVEDTQNRAELKMLAAIREIDAILHPTEEEDSVKRKQLVELAIINGTFHSYPKPDTHHAEQQKCHDRWFNL